MSNIRIKDLPTLNRALATGDVLAIDSGSGSAKVDFSTLKQQVNNVTLVSKSITANGVYDPASDDAYGYSEVTVNVNADVPSGYTRLPYIESDGNQYIDTGVTQTNGVFCEARVCYTSNSGSDWSTICGAQENVHGGGNGRHGVIMLYWDEIKYCAWYGNSYVNTGIAVNFNTMTSYFVSTQDVYTLTIDHVTKYVVKSTGTHVNIPLFIFAMNVGGTPGFFAKARVDYFFIYNSNGQLVREYYAAKRNSDNVLGFWDAVSETFFTNSGSGTFTTDMST